MDIYAGIVGCIDHNMSRVCNYLETIGVLDNTFVLFLSDDGAEGGAHEANPAFQGGPIRYLQKYYNKGLGEPWKLRLVCLVSHEMQEQLHNCGKPR